MKLPLALLLAALVSPLALRAAPAAPVTPDASPEARALLQLLYDLSGRHTLTGQHNYPNTRDRNSRFAAEYLGHAPAVWSTDLGHAKAGDSDSYLARPDIVQEAIRQHRLGSLVTICWHAVPPTADEPVTFRQLPGADPAKLASVQGRLLDEQFRDVLTPGTPLHTRWAAQVDAIAVFLKQLEAAHVPVLWRPYHEMNGDWFWWGGRTGEFSTARLYRQIFDRLVHHHHLKNLIWVWSVDRVNKDKPAMAHENYFPGLDYVDVLGLDVYGNDFADAYYESLVKLSHGKPLALAEVGNPPALAILAKQPLWTYYVTWAGMVRNTTRQTYAALFAGPRYVSLDDPAYTDLTAAYRRACDLPPVAIVPPPANFSGTWIIDEDRSDFGRMGAAFAPARLDVAHDGNTLAIRTTTISESSDDRVTEEKLTLDGAESHSVVFDSPRVATARLAADARELVIDSTLQLAWGPPGSKMTLRETWRLLDAGRRLSIERTATSFMGEQHTTLLFDRR